MNKQLVNPKANLDKIQRKVSITFTNPTPKMPPQRTLFDAVGNHLVKLEKIPMEIVKSKFRMCLRGQDGLWLKRDPRLLQYWVESLWESLYDPISVEKRDHPTRWIYRTKNGRHRMYTLLALGASHVWAYISVKGHTHPFRRRNIRIPRRGASVALCEKCGTPTFVGSGGLKGVSRAYKCGSCRHFAVYRPYPKEVSEII